MFAFMWIATAFSVAGWIVHFHLACLSRREQKAEKGAHDTVASQEDAVSERRLGVRRRVGLSRFWKKKGSGEII
jgi:hypothetical protein